VNGLNLYYEIHGTGKPLALLQGGVGAIEIFGEVLPILAKGRQVIAVDLQAHGRTADIGRPLCFELMADDIAALIKHLGIKSADVMGYSLGGGVALQTAIRHLDVVRKLVLVSTPYKRDGWYPEVLAGMGQMGPDAARRRGADEADPDVPALCQRRAEAGRLAGVAHQAGSVAQAEL
jgi:pimeloyl-ACP methyl ester carboxylesterase